MANEDSNELDIQPDDADENDVLVDYDIATYPSDFTLQGLVDMWDDEDITIPGYQREFVWTIKQSSLLIESFLSGLPVPPVFFYIDDENKNLVVDGQQRILSIVFYFSGYFGSENLQGRRQVFRLKGLNENSPYLNKKFDELDDSDKRKLRTAVLRAINIRQLSPSGDNTSIYHIFERLNTGGTPLKPQEIRNCVFRGGFVQILKDLNEDEDWRKILGRKALDKHQRDVELILRVFSFSKRAEQYEKPIKEFLNKAMRKNRTGESKRVKRFEDDFPAATELIVEKLGEKPFHIRKRINASVLDAVLCTVMDNLSRVPDNLAERYQNLLNDEEFDKTTYLATTDTSVVKKRFKLAKEYLIS